MSQEATGYLVLSILSAFLVRAENMSVPSVRAFCC